jgi:cytochrome c biogenesis protein CcmG, thiol:disulfide interchange protein DsbE
VRRGLWIGGAIALIAVLAIGLSQAGRDAGTQTATDATRELNGMLAELEGAPEPLAALHEQANELLPGERTAFRERLRELRGHPVVVNVWGSWCPPCRAEFPVLQDVSTKLGREVAFLGVNTIDPRDKASAFLAKNPVPYPSIRDERGNLARDVGLTVGAPVTAFYDETGKRVHVKQGEYRRAADLEDDIREYLLP